MKKLHGLMSAALLCVAATAHGAGNADHGKVLSDTCKGCHNAGGIHNPPPYNYHVPQVYGQHADYLTAAMKGYRDGTRNHAQMKALASTLSDQDIADIAAYWSGRDWTDAHNRDRGDAAEGQAKSTTCAACHGADGNSTIPMNPKLAGQYSDYLANALAAYKSGARQSPIMSGMVAALSEQDMADLATYFSRQASK